MMRGGGRSSSLRLEFAGRRSSWWKVELAGGVRVGCREGRKMTAGVPRLFLGSDAPAGEGAPSGAGAGGLGMRQVQE